MNLNNKEFFDDFNEIIMDWSKIDENTLNIAIQTLSQQKVETLFTELQEVINTNEKRKSIVDVSLKVLEVLVKMGMRVL
jgi:hypothetical protein